MPKGDRYLLKADPDDGTTPISHTFLEALAMSSLSGKEKGAIAYIWRKTYGWNVKGHHLKEAHIGLEEFENWLDMKRANVSRMLVKLDNHHVIIRKSQGQGKGYLYSVNTHISEWNNNCIKLQQLSKMITVTYKDNITVIQNDNSPLSKLITPVIQIDNTIMPAKETIKEIYKETTKNTVRTTGKKQRDSTKYLTETEIKTMFGGDPNLAKICEIYSSNISVWITPYIADELKDMATTYPLEWFEAAVKEARLNNARKLSYVRSILERWHTEGRMSVRITKQPSKTIQQTYPPLH